MFVLETKIKLGDGSEKTVAEILGQFLEAGVNLYTVHGNEPASVTGWAEAEAVTIHLADGRSIICSPDVKVQLAGGGYVLAQDAGRYPVAGESGSVGVLSVQPAGVQKLAGYRGVAGFSHSVRAGGIWFLLDE